MTVCNVKGVACGDKSTENCPFIFTSVSAVTRLTGQESRKGKS